MEKTSTDIKKVNIELDEIVLAFESSSPTNHFFIDLEKSEILNINEFTDYKEISFEEVDENLDRYIAIPKKESSEEFMRMEQFIMEIDDEAVREELFTTIKMRKPFRNFEHTLSKYPDLMEKWYKYHNKEIENTMRVWLKQNNIELAGEEVRIRREFGAREISKAEFERLDATIKKELKDFSPQACSNCGFEGDNFFMRLFMVDALPECEKEEEALHREMKKEFDINHFWTSTFDGSNIVILAASRCPYCGSDDIIFDF